MSSHQTPHCRDHVSPTLAFLALAIPCIAAAVLSAHTGVEFRLIALGMFGAMVLGLLVAVAYHHPRHYRRCER